MTSLLRSVSIGVLFLVFCPAFGVVQGVTTALQERGREHGFPLVGFFIVLVYWCLVGVIGWAVADHVRWR